VIFQKTCTVDVLRGHKKEHLQNRRIEIAGTENGGQEYALKNATTRVDGKR